MLNFLGDKIGKLRKVRRVVALDVYELPVILTRAK